MEVPLEVIGIYIGMVVFGLFAYAVIIPYFVMRKVRKMIYTGEFITLLDSEITVAVSDGHGGTRPAKMKVANYLISIFMNNIKMQLNSMKSSMVRSFMNVGESPEGDATMALCDAIVENTPKKWKFVSQMGVMLFGDKIAEFIAKRQAALAAQGQAAPVGAAASHGITSKPWG